MKIAMTKESTNDIDFKKIIKEKLPTIPKGVSVVVLKDYLKNPDLKVILYKGKEYIVRANTLNLSIFYEGD